MILGYAPVDWVNRNPITGTAGCCARAVGGHAAAAAPITPRKSRRRIPASTPRRCIVLACATALEGAGNALGIGLAGDCGCPLWVLSGHREASGSCPLYPQ